MDTSVYEEYDPFAALNIDRDASFNEIKRAYHELSKTHHPDRGGDPEKFKQIAKAYKTLTDKEAQENWRKLNMSELDSNRVTKNEQTEIIDSDEDDEHMDYNQFLFADDSEQLLPSYPLFFMGSLKDACQTAFKPNTIEDRLSVLVYIYHDDSQFREEFCRIMFYSNIIIQYLNMNYIVCPYNITYKSERQTLTNIWEEMFSTRLFDEFSIEECPLLIGIMRLCEYNSKNGIITSEYQFKGLTKGNTLIRTGLKIDHGNLLYELNRFKEECYNNEKHLTFNFVKKTRLSWELILEIAEYLSISDIINTFSIDIFTLLDENTYKMKLLNPYDPLIRIILREIKIKQITSLQINANRLQSKNELNFLSNFQTIRSITLYNLSYSIRINQYTIYLPALIRLCLYYDDKVNYRELIQQLIYFPQQIKQFEIHCAGTFSDHVAVKDLNSEYSFTTSIEYFLLNISRYPLVSTKNYFQDYKSWFNISISSFMKNMTKIRYFHIICNKYNIECFLDNDPWKYPLHKCTQLTKIVFKIVKNTYENEQWLTKKVLEIQSLLRNIKQTIRFELIFI
ncbi:hypothetical protein I4U23_027495 [Adineta vaga]|nr:hypothetical protein I4U23_027495 [Adineta vaga]